MSILSERTLALMHGMDWKLWIAKEEKGLNTLNWGDCCHLECIMVSTIDKLIKSNKLIK